MVLPRLAAKGLRVGEDFFLAYSPEREDPGNRKYTLARIPKVVGGVTPACRELACTLYGQVIEQVVPVSSEAVAEATKVLENIYRAVNIALVGRYSIISPASMNTVRSEMRAACCMLCVTMMMVTSARSS